MIRVESEGLSGEGVMVSVREEVPGGMMSQPIPGHMLQTVEKTPQVSGGGGGGRGGGREGGGEGGRGGGREGGREGGRGSVCGDIDLRT